MASEDLQITALPVASVVASTDIVALINDPDTTPAPVRATVAQIVAAGAPPAVTLGTFASPNSNVTASPGQLYIDTNNNTLWYKKTGTGNTGWEQLL